MFLEENQHIEFKSQFNGYSIPRNKELMRVFKDLELVEQLGSGIPRILQYYSKDCFVFSENFIRIIFPIDKDFTEQVTEQVCLLVKLMQNNYYSTSELMDLVNIKHRPTFLYNYLQPSIEHGLIELMIPDKPTSSKQKYRLTVKRELI